MSGTKHAGPIGTKSRVKVLRDISSTFKFPEPATDGYFWYKEASGKLGEPGTVVTHRNVKEQRDVSEGTGEDAGHLIGIRFGAPGGFCNLGLQNSNMNRRAPRQYQGAFQGSGGSYLDLENQWERKLHAGWEIYVVVTDKYRVEDTERPIGRKVVWDEISPPPVKVKSSYSLYFGNWDSPQKRAAEGKNPPGDGPMARVIPIRRT